MFITLFFLVHSSQFSLYFFGYFMSFLHFFFFWHEIVFFFPIKLVIKKKRSIQALVEMPISTKYRTKSLQRIIRLGLNIICIIFAKCKLRGFNPQIKSHKKKVECHQAIWPLIGNSSFYVNIALVKNQCMIFITNILEQSFNASLQFQQSTSFFCFFLESFNLWCSLLKITPNQQTKTPIGFWYRREIRPLIQLLEILLVELTGTHLAIHKLISYTKSFRIIFFIFWI